MEGGDGDLDLIMIMQASPQHLPTAPESYGVPVPGPARHQLCDLV